MSGFLLIWGRIFCDVARVLVGDVQLLIKIKFTTVGGFWATPAVVNLILGPKKVKIEIKWGLEQL